ncbi:TIGR01777 family protein [Chloroflexia bacterium SDU3-3]|nr:TIGR01777 family protein [Chloroflexia bacterium SDU3-3]
MDNPSLVIAGGSGFLGQAMARHLSQRGYRISILTRGPARTSAHATYIPWDAQSVGPWAHALDGAAAVINLAGKSVNTRYTPANRREIIESRVRSVRAIDQAMRRCQQPPPLWVQAGSLAIYGDTTQTCAEDAPYGEGFPVETCIAWEQAFAQASYDQRKVLLRIGFVLDAEGGALEPLAKLARLGLGGAAGSGQQYISWLHIHDFHRIIMWCLSQQTASGTYNVTGPSPATNQAFMAALRRSLHRPWSPPIPSAAVRIGAWAMRTEADLVLKGRRCIPARLLRESFTFDYPELRPALDAIFAPAAPRAALG